MSTIDHAGRRSSLLAQLTTLADEIVESVGVLTCVIFVAAIALGSWALGIYVEADLTLAYGDSIARLNIARGVLDSTTPSFSQLGGVWLPLPQVLMLPTIWSDTLWHTGLAGSVVSVLAFGLSTAYIHRSIQALTQDGRVAVIGSALFATNANLLYMQATPMVEALTIFLVLGATFHLLRWVQGESLFHFVMSAGFVLAATLTRYEAWVLVPAGLLIVTVAAFQRQRRLDHVEGFSLAWGVLASYGICLWLLYNQVIFGDLLYFSSGPGAASAFASLAEADGLLPTKHDPVASASIFGWSVIDTIGLPLALAGAAGAILLLASRAPLSTKLAALLPVSLLFFHVASLTAGQSVLWSPHSFPNLFYNTRYGLLILPAAVIAASYLAVPLRSIGLLLLGAALLPQLLALPSMPGGVTEMQSEAAMAETDDVAKVWVDSNFPLLEGGQPVTLVEALTFDQGREEAAADWIGEYATEGRILISAQASGAAALMFRSGLPLSRFVSEGNKPFFNEELESPGKHTRWIVYQPEQALDGLRPFMEGDGPPGFHLALQAGGFQVFEWSKTTAITPRGQADSSLNISAFEGITP